MNYNIIYNDRDEAIGYYQDLRRALEQFVIERVQAHDYENAQAECEKLAELDQLRDYDELIVLSENNGMGFTAKTYEQVMKEKENK